MLGHDHALSGALAFAFVAPLLPVSGTQLAVAAALTAGAGILPDLDEPGSTIARTFGFLTGGFAWIVHQLSGGHRKGTHSLLGVALMTLLALWAGSWQRSAPAQHPEVWWHLVPAGLILALLFSAGFRALYIGGHHGDLFGIGVAALVIWQGWDLVEVTSWHVPLLAVCVALGMLAHLAGDMLTHDGCPLLYPVSRYEFGLLPEPIRITTNKLAERWVISPLLLIGLAYFVWRDAGGPVLTGHLAGRLRAPDRPGRRRAVEHGLGHQVVADGPSLAGRRVEAVTQDGGERGEEGVFDGPVVGDPHPIADVPRAQRAGVTEQLGQPRHGPHDLGELLGEPDLLYGHVGSEQRTQSRVSPEQLLVEPGGQGRQFRAEAGERGLHQRDLLRRHVPLPRARASSARLLTPSLA